MNSRKSFLLVAVLVGYLVLLAIILLYLPSPWNYAVAALVVFKAGVFWGVMQKAAGIGSGRRIPPPQ